jgi:predicted amidohydrolase YtcJ
MSTTAELIVVADRVHTMNPGRPHAQAVAIRDGLITGIGDRDDVRQWRGAGTEVVDLGAATITPGLVDGHIHPVLGLGLTQGADLSAVGSVPELIRALRAAQRADPGEWVLGWGLNPNVFGTDRITAEPLVEALGDVPALVVLFDAHSAIATPAALKRAGIDGPREFDGAAEVVCDSRGVPTGHLLELPAYELVSGVLPAQSPATRRARLADLLRAMAATGLTAGNAMDFDGDSEQVVGGLAQEIDLPLRLRFAPMCMPGATRGFLDHVIEQQRLGGRRWAVDGVKFMIDGTIDGGTAWLEHADSHGESAAPFWPEPQAYTEAARYFAAAGVPTVTHAIGDAADPGAAPDRAHRDDPGRPAGPVPGLGRHRQHAAHPLHPLHERRPQRQLVGAARHGAGQSRVPLPRPARRRGTARARFRLAGRAVRCPAGDGGGETAAVGRAAK